MSSLRAKPHQRWLIYIDIRVQPMQGDTEFQRMMVDLQNSWKAAQAKYE